MNEIEISNWDFYPINLSINFVIFKFEAILAVDYIWVIQSNIDQVWL